MHELLRLGLGPEYGSRRSVGFEGFQAALSMIADRRFPGEGQGLCELVASYLAPLTQRLGLSNPNFNLIH